MVNRLGNAPASKQAAWRLALCIVFLAALALRLYGLDWDDGADLHPDELFVAKIVLIDRIHLAWPPDLDELLDPARSGLNPRSADPVTGRYREFAYGALPLWVTDATAALLGRLTGTNWNAMDRAYLVGRSISALLSALTILPVAAIGTAVAGRAVGLLAALFAALAPMSVQLAHFFTTDSWLTFFVALALLACIYAAHRGTPWRFATAGVAIGLALATKGSVFTLTVPLAMALTIDAAQFWMNSEKPARNGLPRTIRQTMAAAAGTLVAFLLFEPYAVLRPDVYLQSLRTQAEIVSGAFDVPFSRVYVGTTPLIYQLEQLVRWGYGPAAGLLALLGTAVLIIRSYRGANVAALILVSWLAAYGAVLFVAEVKFLRYLEPLSPVLAVSAALGLIWLRAALTPRWPTVARLAAPAALVLAVTWSAAFLSVYAHENPRLAATKWLYATAPPGSALSSEYWDDALPRALSYTLSPANFGFSSIVLDLYRDLPPAEASDAIFNGISRADYIVQSSRRVEAAVTAAPWRYPVQGRYFDQLSRGRLGFSHAAEFLRSPTFAGISVDDSAADESFVNYDHPHVSVYQQQQSEPITRSRFDDAMAWALQRPWSSSREAVRPTLLLDQPVGENPSVNDGRWSAAITSATPAALAVWILLLMVLLVVGLPLARLVFPAFPDAGWGLARPLALVVAAYPIWLGASLDLFRFRAMWAGVALTVMAVFGWKQFLGARRRTTWRPSSNGAWAHAEGAFWLVFLLFLLYRLINPDGWHPLWGGEKPMEFAQINAIERSAYFPPYDPWFADGYINYYYYGFYLVAFLFKVTGIPAEVGLNLALPTFMGLLAGTGYSVGAALAQGLTRSRRFGIAGGWFAVVALCLLGNLSALAGFFADGRSLTDPFLFWTWRGSRAIDNVITEFPYFSGLYADLHAHVVALPLTMLVIGLSLALATESPTPTAHGKIWRNRSPVVLRVALLALTLGSLAVTNAWDVPVYGVLAITASLMATGAIPGFRHRSAVFLTMSVAIAGGAWLLFLPFHRHFVALFSQLAPVRDPTDLMQFLTHFGGLLAVAAFGLTYLLLARVAVPNWLAFWPAFSLTILVVGVAVRLFMPTVAAQLIGGLLVATAFGSPPLLATWLRTATRPVEPDWTTALVRGGAILAAVAAVACIATGRDVLGTVLPLAIAAATGWLQLTRPSERFVCLLLAAACFIAAGAEVVVVADDLIDTPAYRMNTVFKFYNQVWVLLSLSVAALVSLMLRDAILPVRARSRSARRPDAAWARSGVAVSLVVLLASLGYPLLATGPRLAQQFDPGSPPGTLNALAWMESGSVPIIERSGERGHRLDFRGDAEAIRWLFTNVEGTPVIAEASIGPYRCNGSRISNATGLPTIIGWERHEQQQRYPETLSARVEDVRTLYTSPDITQKAAILFRYNVEYLIVGDLERLYPLNNNECTPTGSPEGIAAFEDMIGKTLEVAHAARGTTIYRVLPPGSA